MVHIKDIAQICNVSPATVSKALNDQSDIGEATKEYIKQVAKEMGYMPNSAARALKTSKTNNIGVLFVDEQNRGLSHEYFSTMLESIKSHAEQLGYDVTFINSGNTMSFLQHCKYRGLDGVVIANINFHNPQIRELIDSDVPVVTIDYDFGKKVSVLSDNEAGGYAVMQYAIEMGHRNIGIIHGDMTSVTEKRLKGMFDCLEEKGIVIPKTNIKAAKFHDSMVSYFATQELLRLQNRPTCILFPDDYSYIGGYNAIRDAGLEIPTDISVIGYDGIELSRIISPRLVTYHQDTAAMGEMAVKKLVEQIDQPKKEFCEAVEVSGYLLDGGSVSQLDA